MPYFYHVHRGNTHSLLYTNINKNQTLFLSKKNSLWYNIEKNIGKKEYGGYIIYKIYIPINMFTHSFNPISSNKIIKIDMNNIDTFIQLKNIFPGNINFLDELKKRNLIGYDATNDKIYKKASKGTDFYTPELAIFDFNNYTPGIVIYKIYKIKN